MGLFKKEENISSDSVISEEQTQKQDIFPKEVKITCFCPLLQSTSEGSRLMKFLYSGEIIEVTGQENGYYKVKDSFWVNKKATENLTEE